MKLTVFFLFSYLMVFPVAAGNYYISSDGDDGNSGESPEQAWRTLEQVNNSMHIFLPGDSVLFRRGDTFRGYLHINCNGSADAPVVFSCYGSGKKAVIDGSVTLPEWTPGSGGIWKADRPETVTGEVKNLFIDGEFASLARHPDEGFYFTSDPEGKTVFSASEMASFSGNYWEGADIAVRTANWIIDVLPIDSVDGERVVLKEEATYNLLPGYGFFIQNHVHALDREGEWAWTDDGSIYIFMEESDPNDTEIIIPEQDLGIYIDNSDYISIRGLKVSYQKEAGVVAEYSDHVGLYGNEVFYSGTDALRTRYVNYLEAENNILKGANNNGLDMNYTKESTFRQNTVRNIGSVPGRGLNGNLKYMGILINRSENLLFQYNNIDSIGYNGISFFRSGNIEIRNNAVSYACLVKDDGGGIYTWENQKPGNVVSGNVVTYTTGEQSGVPPAKKHKAHGIYIDDRSYDLLVENNTAAYNHDFGIYIHNAKNVVISGNTLVDNDVQLGFGGGEDWPGNEVTGNIFVCTDDEMLCVRMYGSYNYDENFPAFDSNVYGKFTVFKIAFQSYEDEDGGHAANLIFDQWKEISGDENMSGWPVPYHDSISRQEFLFFVWNTDPDEVTIPLDHSYRDMKNLKVEGNVAIPPYSSVVLVKDTAPLAGTYLPGRFPGEEICIYPNPSSGPVTLELKNPGMVDTLEIFNSKGTLLDCQDIHKADNPYRIDMGPFGTGIYFIRIRMQDRVATKNLVIKN